MAYQTLPVAAGWPPSARCAAIGAAQIRLVNGQGGQGGDATLIDGERRRVFAPRPNGQPVAVTMMA